MSAFNFLVLSVLILFLSGNYVATFIKKYLFYIKIMVNVVMTGHRLSPMGNENQFLDNLVSKLSREDINVTARMVDVSPISSLSDIGSLDFDLRKGVMEPEARARRVSEFVDKLLDANPDVVHYHGFRDQYSGVNVDEMVLREIDRRGIPILLTGGSTIFLEEGEVDGKTFAERSGIRHLELGLGSLDDYVAAIKELSDAGNYWRERITKVGKDGIPLYSEKGHGFGNLLFIPLCKLDDYLKGSIGIKEVVRESMPYFLLLNKYVIPEQVKDNPMFLGLRLVYEETKAQIDQLQKGFEYLQGRNPTDKKKEVAKIMMEMMVVFDQRLADAVYLFSTFEEMKLNDYRQPDCVRAQVTWPPKDGTDIGQFNSEVEGSRGIIFTHYRNRITSELAGLEPIEADAEERRIHTETLGSCQWAPSIHDRSPSLDARTQEIRLRLHYALTIGGVPAYVNEVNRLFKEASESPQLTPTRISTFYPESERIAPALINFSSARALGKEYKERLEHVMLN